MRLDRGGLVEAWFDEVLVDHDSRLLEVDAIEPATGSTAGGDEIRVLGRVFRKGVTVTLGGVPLVDAVRVSTCEIVGMTPPGEAGAVDVVVANPSGEVTLAGGFIYGEVAGDPLFVRGDCSGDGEMNISDGIAVLNFLFLGSAAPPCLEACNVGNDANLDVSDGVGVLNFLFLGGAEPAAPYPDCGTDPGGEGSCESAHESCS